MKRNKEARGEREIQKYYFAKGEIFLGYMKGYLQEKIREIRYLEKNDEIQKNTTHFLQVAIIALKGPGFEYPWLVKGSDFSYL